jgi:hypothetical protein
MHALAVTPASAFSAAPLHVRALHAHALPGARSALAHKRFTPCVRV